MHHESHRRLLSSCGKHKLIMEFLAVLAPKLNISWAYGWADRYLQLFTTAAPFDPYQIYLVVVLCGKLSYLLTWWQKWPQATLPSVPVNMAEKKLSNTNILIEFGCFLFIKSWSTFSGTPKRGAIFMYFNEFTIWFPASQISDTETTNCTITDIQSIIKFRICINSK